MPSKGSCHAPKKASTQVPICSPQEDHGSRVLTPQEEQIKWLQDAGNSVKRNAFYMKRALVR